MSDDGGRKGLLQDLVSGRLKPPPSAVTLGWELLDVDPEAGTIKVAFEATERFLNPAGAVQGGFLSAMLDDTLGPALIATMSEGEFVSTLDLHVQFLRPARPGRIIGEGRIVKRGREVCFLAGELIGPDGKTLATATATSVVRMAR
jgi:uncharacterized protein (TIGR00369 family)